MAYNPRHDLDGETLGLRPGMRALASTLYERQAQLDEERRQEDLGLNPKRVFGQPVLDLMVRLLQRRTEETK